MTTTEPLSLTEQYRLEFAGSARLACQARSIFPDGVTHDIRRLDPFPVYITHAVGAHKWDVDGHRLIDYFSGHGSLLLGHSHPAVVSAVQQQMTCGTHLGACHELEIAWAKRVQQLIPTAERVRFTSSGTEASLMAFRLARLVTGRPKVLKFAGHFHGWHDAASPAADPPYDNPAVPGVPESIAANTVVIPPNDIPALERVLSTSSDIAAVILEPTGGHWGQVPIRGPFLRALRELTVKYGQLLIFDEVITGFRVHPGGAQAYYGVNPDLTTLAKVLAGGLPGGALVGRADLLEAIATRAGKPKLRHPGTFNGNPLSAAAGIAALDLVATITPVSQANTIAALLRKRLNEMFESEGLNWCAYGEFSWFHLLPNYQGPRPVGDTPEGTGDLIPYDGELNRLDGPKDRQLMQAFRQGMLLHGVDVPGFGGWLSASHSEADVTATVAAVAATVRRL